MTRHEVLQKYKIPVKHLNMYESIKKCSNYSDEDIETISMMMTVFDAGFDDSEAGKYLDLCFSDEDTAEKRTEILVKQREHILNAIHTKQRQLDCIDYLRYRIKKEKASDKKEEF